MKNYTPNCEILDGMTLPDGLTRQALTIEYNGRNLHGFQKQASTPHTVQAHLERAISRIANEPVTLVCAGRTDAGVHASAQVVHFDTFAKRPNTAWVEGVNTQLPDHTRVIKHHSVPLQFHARFSAEARTYRYVIYPNRTRPAILEGFVTWVPHELNVEMMQSAAAGLIGEHDFSSFRASQCQAATPVRRLESLRLFRAGAFIVLEVTASAFLHHMVRNIVGMLLEVGRGAKPVSWAAHLLSVRDRTQNAATAPPYGLFFVNVRYPPEYGFATTPLGPVFLQHSDAGSGVGVSVV